jgi:hypothetical protein
VCACKQRVPMLMRFSPKEFSIAPHFEKRCASFAYIARLLKRVPVVKGGAVGR